jgi:hypothetical protein
LIAVSCALGWSRATDREKQGRARLAKFPSSRDAKLAREAIPMSDVHLSKSSNCASSFLASTAS